MFFSMTKHMCCVLPPKRKFSMARRSIRFAWPPNIFFLSQRRARLAGIPPPSPKNDSFGADPRCRQTSDTHIAPSVRAVSATADPVSAPPPLPPRLRSAPSHDGARTVSCDTGPRQRDQRRSCLPLSTPHPPARLREAPPRDPNPLRHCPSLPSPPPLSPPANSAVDPTHRATAVVNCSLCCALHLHRLAAQKSFPHCVGLRVREICFHCHNPAWWHTSPRHWSWQTPR